MTRSKSGFADHTKKTSEITATGFARPRMHWEMLPADRDTVLVRGLEFLIIGDDGHILVDYQFFPA